MNTYPLYISFLWHMHQPYYKDIVENRFFLPWVRLHSVKDYLDMLLILKDFPDIKLNFNFVPSLLTQIQDYLNNNIPDIFLDHTLKVSSELTDEEKKFILINFFSGNWDNLVKPFPRYYELLLKRGQFIQEETILEKVEEFSHQDITDLQLLFNLSWIDPYFIKNDNFLKSTVKKERNYSEREKKEVIKKHFEIMKQIIPKYKEMLESNRIEISISPFYHPILPLLIDSNIAKESMPNVILPKDRFTHPEDAQYQIRNAVEFYEKTFNQKPKGMWPSEGAVSQSMVKLVIEEGLEWIASDEEILGASILSNPHDKDLLYQPYTVEDEGKTLSIIFRNKKLSDLIGFSYRNIHYKEAVKHFIKELNNIRETIKKFPGPHLVSIILDGENCWEYYPNDGWDFLSYLYEKLSKTPWIKTVRINDYLKEFPPQKKIDYLASGSWINRNFGIWIGHPEDNLAWEYLHKTRKFIKNYELSHSENSDNISKAWQCIYIAEGSDWNWWYGEDHSSTFDIEFDFLFRKHLMNVFKILDEEIPVWLKFPIISKEKPKYIFKPVEFIFPVLDGKITSYYEWIYAGGIEIGTQSDTMHPTDIKLTKIFYGFNMENMYIRLDWLSLEELNFIIKIHFIYPYFKEIWLNLKEKRMVLYDVSHKLEIIKELLDFAIKDIIEIKISFSDLNVLPGENIEFVISIWDKTIALEQWPKKGVISFRVPDKDFLIEHWQV